jgi:SPX domain protein involved in polyphosphate accumulation
MGILGTIDRCLHGIQYDLIKDMIVYVELDRDNYKVVLEEVELKVQDLTSVSNSSQLSVELNQKVKDFGKCTILNYMGYKIIISENDKKIKDECFYLAFKTKII